MNEELEDINRELLGIEIKITNQIEECKRTLTWIGCLRNRLYRVINSEEISKTED